MPRVQSAAERTANPVDPGVMDFRANLAVGLSEPSFCTTRTCTTCTFAYLSPRDRLGHTECSTILPRAKNFSFYVADE